MSLYCKKLCFVLAICLMVPSAIAETKTETDYLAILMEGKKIGYAEYTRIVEDGKVTTHQQMAMMLGRGGQTVKIESSETHIETSDGKPLGFEMRQTMSGIEQKRIGVIADGKVTVAVETAGQPQSIAIDWPKGALLNEGMRLVQEQQGLKEGTAYEVDIFRPDMMMALKSQVAVGKKEVVDLLGRVVELTEVKVTMQIPGQPITVTSYVNDDLKAVKTLVPMLGMVLEMVQCDKAFALREDDVVDFLDRLSVKSPSELTDIAGKASIEYQLSPTGSETLIFPTTSSQAVHQDGDRIVVTVKPYVPENDPPLPYNGDNAEVLAALKPTEYLQSDNAKVKELADAAVGATTETLKAARQIESFVKGYIVTKDLSVGYATAAEVAQSRQGDCSEHAVLTAAMCRAAGIPARVVCGVVYAEAFIGQKSVFGGHMWTEVFVDGGWVGLDATRAPKGFGPGHIAMAVGDGNPSDFFSLVNTLGCFKIDKITVIPKKETTVTKGQADADKLQEP